MWESRSPCVPPSGPSSLKHPHARHMLIALILHREMERLHEWGSASMDTVFSMVSVRLLQGDAQLCRG